MLTELPEIFAPKIKDTYPPNNHTIFEQYFFEQYYTRGIELEREYLPIQWTAYFVNNNYGNNQYALGKLQEYINSLDKTKKYFTVIQYDDGILVDVSKLDLYVFGMSGKCDYDLPLLCQAHPYIIKSERPYFASFIGNKTHPIRNVVFGISDKDCYIQQKAHQPRAYCEVLAKSVFSLCPRGYGINSFRIAESIQYGAIPVYISDVFSLPPHIPFEDFGVIVKAEDVPRLMQVLRAIPKEEIARKKSLLKEVYVKYYSYEPTFDLIVNTVTNLDTHRKQ